MKRIVFLIIGLALTVGGQALAQKNRHPTIIFRKR